MGIQVEFNPDLALRKFKTPGRSLEECLPESLRINQTYSFLKEGQRNYWLEGEIPLLETQGNQQLSRPLASIKMIEVTHILINSKPYTKGTYQVIDVFDENDPEVKFESYKRIK